MLVLSRHKGEVVVIQAGSKTIRVTLIELRGDKCRLGFDADTDVAIHRQEVYDAIVRTGGDLITREGGQP